MKYKYLLLFAFLLLGMGQPKWEAILLIRNSASNFHVFVDRYQNLNDLEVVAEIDGEKYHFSLKEYGRNVKIPFGKEGWIGVRTDNKWLASIRLGGIRDCSIKYFEERIVQMSLIDEQNGFKEALVDAAEEEIEKNESKAEFKIFGIEKVNSDLDIIDASDAKAVANRRIHLPNRVLGLNIFEQFLVEYDPYNFEIDPYSIMSVNDIPSEIIETAEFMKENYVAEHDLGNFLIVSDLKTDKKYFFDGDKLFNFSPNDFKLQWDKHTEMFRFFNAHNIKMKPESRRWLGLYIGDEFIGAFKRKLEYKFELEGEDKLLITSKKGMHSIEVKNYTCKVTANNGKYVRVLELDENNMKAKRQQVDLQLAQFQD
ncbi:hypothetical protein [Sediminitomix flava]|uniref:Uncharacterized protein n=1 Tax=Sediminitomix flava TaxID=379075 RepID=A0A315Z7N3_SEDFL|nr:hypothetical protein [Sediminitomix flava]PWJ40164.1 hypothetical protein BC781_105232 [Sediminitomix flava]